MQQQVDNGRFRQVVPVIGAIQDTMPHRGVLQGNLILLRWFLECLAVHGALVNLGYQWLLIRFFHFMMFIRRKYCMTFEKIIKINFSMIRTRRLLALGLHHSQLKWITIWCGMILIQSKKRYKGIWVLRFGAIPVHNKPLVFLICLFVVFFYIFFEISLKFFFNSNFKIL